MKGLSLLNLKARSRELSRIKQAAKKEKPKAPLTKEGEDKYHLAYWYMRDSMAALEKAMGIMLTVDREAHKKVQTIYQQAAPIAGAFHTKYRNRRRR